MYLLIAIPIVLIVGILIGFFAQIQWYRRQVRHNHFYHFIKDAGGKTVEELLTADDEWTRIVGALTHAYKQGGKRRDADAKYDLLEMLNRRFGDAGVSTITSDQKFWLATWSMVILATIVAIVTIIGGIVLNQESKLQHNLVPVSVPKQISYETIWTTKEQAERLLDENRAIRRPSE